MLCLLPLLGAMASAPGAAAQASLGSTDWPQFQGSASHEADASSSTLEPPLRRLWRFSGSDEHRGLSGPVVAGGTVVAVGTRAVYGVDASTGDQRWDVGRGGGPIAVPAVGATGGREIVVFTEGATRSESAVVAVDAATRGQLWKRPLKHVSESGVTIDGDLVLVGDREGNLYGFDLASGRPEDWSPKAIGGGGIDAPPAVASGEVYTVTRNHDSGDVRVVALQESTGSVDWDYSPNFAAGTGSAITVHGDAVYFGLGSELKVHALSATTGAELWSSRTRSPFSPFGAPAYADGRLLIVGTSTSESAVYSFDATIGDKQWDFEFQDGTIRSSPVVVGDTVYVGIDDGRVVGIDIPSELEVWEDPTGDGRIGPLAVSGQQLIASKRGSRGGLIAYGPNPGGRLLHIESPTKLHLGTDLARYAIAVAIVFAVVYGGTLAFRRARGERGPAEPDTADVEPVEAPEES